MRSRPPVASALLLASLLFWGLLPLARAQAPANGLEVAADYELFGASQLVGGGHVTWTLTGDAARSLRSKILGMYDEYVQIPRGFSFASASTGGDGDGLVDGGEGLAYTGHLENVLEGAMSNFTGTPIGYVRLGRADLFEAGAGGLARSTSGLLGSRGNSTEDLSIRFLVSGSTDGADLRMDLPTRAYADALHSVFSFRDGQSPSLTATPPYPAAWPLAEGDWRVTTADDGGPALWAGNATSGLYDDSITASTTAYADPLLGAALDLRFATQASVGFSYTGQTAGPGDQLRFEVATAPGFGTWTPLLIGGQAAVPTTPAGTWSNVSLDLAGYLGQKVRLRFTFVSDAAGQGRGFFVRDFAVDAPSRYEGILVQSDAHYLVGPVSFSEPSLSSGSVTLLRTPGGEILYYSAAWDTAAPPADTIRFQSFDPLENPQALFAVMVAGAYLLSRSQELAYDRFRAAQPTVHGSAAHKARWLHALGKVAIVLLVVLYFVPTAFYFVRVRVFIAGPLYLVLAIGLTTALALGTRAYYARRSASVPTRVGMHSDVLGSAGRGEHVLAPDQCAQCLRSLASERAYTCECGAPYHPACASARTHCAVCGEPIAVEVVRKQRVVSTRCPSCGEEQTYPLGEDPRLLACGSCKAPLKQLDPGRSYLVIASDPAIPFDWLRDVTRSGRPGVCLVTAAPERLRLEFAVTKRIEITQVSRAAPGAIDPRRLDPMALKALEPLLRLGGGALLWDAIDQMIFEASLDDVLRFLRRAKDALRPHRVTIIVRMSPGNLTPAHAMRLAEEFDEVIDLAARAAASPADDAGPAGPEAMLDT